MVAPELAREAQQAITLIKAFSLELNQYSPESQVLYWLNQHRAAWIRDAIIEAVYQGRYKVISVQHILLIWQRRGQPVRHFTSGFEQVIAAQLGTPLHLSTATASQPTSPVNEVRPDETRFSPISADELSHQTNTISQPSVEQRSPHERFSIEAFPVQTENTLVNVYQATTPTRKTRVKKPSFQVTTARKKPVTTASYPGKSLPIQPFRPMPRRRKSTPTR
ncbi:MAG: hypothetical protein AAGI69_27815 [Cyanobacteria bacterium P01_H01_bin.21]